MDKQNISILPKGFSVNEKYSVMLHIKQGDYANTYRVKGKDGKIYFLKLFNLNRIHHSALDDEKNILEIEISKSLNHPNIISYVDNGELIFNDKKYAYLVLNFISGETLTESIRRKPFESLYDIKQIISAVLNGIKHLHSQPEPIIHNDLTPQNIMIDLSGKIPKSIIIDFGYARSYFKSSKTFSTNGLNLNYVATECFNNFYSPQSDLYSIGTILYQLLYNNIPWYKDVSSYNSNKREEIIIAARSKPLILPEKPDNLFDFDESILKVVKKALNQDPEKRFQSADEFNKALNGEIEVNESETLQLSSNVVQDKKKILKKKQGIGFNAIAGMKDLKEQLQLDVIDALNNPEEYAKYGVTIPNGMLLYGPPGCGKTFFAKHFAEEVGFNFVLATPSTLKSKYVNATQENIVKMFNEAEKNAPTIIFIDEINELLPNRESDVHEMSKSAVNEMLAQMDRTGEKGIFIIGATNFPEMIDPAILRAGRLDKKFYLPPPDFEARKSMFEMYLKARPIDFGMDYDILSELTENYVSSDIEFLVNEAARKALKLKTRINMEILESVIKITKPSVPLSELEKYEKVRIKMNSENNDNKPERPRIGF